MSKPWVSTALFDWLIVCLTSEGIKHLPSSRHVVFILEYLIFVHTKFSSFILLNMNGYLMLSITVCASDESQPWGSFCSVLFWVLFVEISPSTLLTPPWSSPFQKFLCPGAIAYIFPLEHLLVLFSAPKSRALRWVHALWFASWQVLYVGLKAPVFSVSSSSFLLWQYIPGHTFLRYSHFCIYGLYLSEQDQENPLLSSFVSFCRTQEMHIEGASKP